MQSSRRSLTPFWRSLSTSGSPYLLASRSPTSAISRHVSILAANNTHQLRNLVASQLLAKSRTASTTTKPPTSQYARTITTDASGSPSRLIATDSPATSEPIIPKREDQPAYEITFTCKPCQTRSTHKMSKQGYHKGTILITCPSCKDRHLICDHLKIFRDTSTTIEDIIKEKGESVKYGYLGADGDIEIWDDGTTTERAGSKQTSPGGGSISAPESSIQPPNP